MGDGVRAASNLDAGSKRPSIRRRAPFGADSEQRCSFGMRTRLVSNLEPDGSLTVHADLNDTTRGMFNAAAFARMKPIGE